MDASDAAPPRKLLAAGRSVSGASAVGVLFAGEAAAEALLAAGLAAAGGPPGGGLTAAVALPVGFHAAAEALTAGELAAEQPAECSAAFACSWAERIELQGPEGTAQAQTRPADHPEQQKGLMRSQRRRLPPAEQLPSFAEPACMSEKGRNEDMYSFIGCTHKIFSGTVWTKQQGRLPQGYTFALSAQ